MRSLPPDLTYLGMPNYFFDTLLLSLPQKLVFISFSVVKEKFCFKHLSYFPQSIQVMSLYLVDDDDMYIFRRSLKDILDSLPRSIKSFSCITVSKHEITKMHLIMDDCVDSWSDHVESKKIDIFSLHSPPFLNYFRSDLIDPYRSFAKAMVMLQ